VRGVREFRFGQDERVWSRFSEYGVSRSHSSRARSASVCSLPCPLQHRCEVCANGHRLSRRHRCPPGVAGWILRR
jgi:hypothetical protein